MKRIDRFALLIGLILLISLLLRLWGIDYDLPYIYHPDEPSYLRISQRIFKNGDLNPHFFNYPSLFFYINSFAYIPYFLIGKILGIFTSRVDISTPMSLAMGVTFSPYPTTVLMGRIITLIFSIASVGITYIIGKQLTGKKIVGLLAALMLSVSSTHIIQSRMITPDIFVSFFTLAAFLGSVFVFQQGRTRDYIFAGICVGLTASTKYNGALILLPLVLAHFLRNGKNSFKEGKLYLTLLFCGLGFLATTPFALFDFQKFMTDLTFESRHYATGHAGMEGDSLKWYVEYMWQTGGMIYLLSILGIISGIYSRSREIFLLSSFPLVYFVFISSFQVRNDRTFLPMIPFLFLLAAMFIQFLLKKANGLKSDMRRNLSIISIIGYLIISVILPITLTINNNSKLTPDNSREVARIWASNNLPQGSKIALESYSPFIDPVRFSVQGIGRMIDQKPEWYIENGFDYLIFGQGMYGRFYREPERYSQEVRQYNDFFDRFELVQLFPDSYYEIRVYKVR